MNSNYHARPRVRPGEAENEHEGELTGTAVDEYTQSIYWSLSRRQNMFTEQQRTHEKVKRDNNYKTSNTDPRTASTDVSKTIAHICLRTSFSITVRNNIYISLSSYHNMYNNR